MNLATVPQLEWDALASMDLTLVVHGRVGTSPAGIAIAMRNKGLLEDFRRALPDFAAEDIVGSPYCVRRYVVDKHLGGPEGLAAARKALAKQRYPPHSRFRSKPCRSGPSVGSRTP